MSDNFRRHVGLRGRLETNGSHVHKAFAWRRAGVDKAGARWRHIPEKERQMAKKTWFLGAGAAAAAAMALFAAPAQAGGSIHLNIGGYYPQPYVYTQPSYVYTQPAYVYTQPGYVYYGQPHYHYGHRRDRDRDGIPNRWDRDRDNDGVPNRYDRRPNNPYRR
jgi:hypothetical protein